MGEERGCIGSWWGNRRERAHWGDLGVDGWIILGWICRRWDVGIWTGLGWPRLETVGGRLWVRWWTFGFPWNAGNFLTSCKPVSFSRWTLHHGVSKYYTRSDNLMYLLPDDNLSGIETCSGSRCFGKKITVYIQKLWICLMNYSKLCKELNSSWSQARLWQHH